MKKSDLRKKVLDDLRGLLTRHENILGLLKDMKEEEDVEVHFLLPPDVFDTLWNEEDEERKSATSVDVGLTEGRFEAVRVLVRRGSPMTRTTKLRFFVAGNEY